MRRATLALVVGLLAGLGGYVLIYLFRWEWHRAMMVALFFIAVEIGLGVGLLLRRLIRVEQRLEELEQPPDHSLDPSVLARLRDAAPAGRGPFPWLDPRDQKLGVFLPFLLGFGALASVLAWVVEQFARRTTVPALERRLARSLMPLALPTGGLLGGAPTGIAAPRRRSSLRRAVPGLAAAVVVVVAAATVDWLGDELQTRPDAPRSDVATVIDLQLRGVRVTAWPEQAAATLWGTCSHVLHGRVGAASIHPLGGGRFEILVPTHIGRSAEARVRGCLQDAVVDRLQAHVISVEAVQAS